MSGQAQPPKLSLGAVFLVFLKIGTFAFGGSYAMISFFERELVEKRGWIARQEFLESLAIGEMAPGSPIINTGVAVGYKLGGLPGVLASTVGQALTGTVLAVLLAAFYLQTREHPVLQAVMKGAAAAAVGLLGSIVSKMGRQFLTGRLAAAFGIGAFIALAVFHLNPLAVMLVAGALGVAIYWRRQNAAP